MKILYKYALSLFLATSILSCEEEDLNRTLLTPPNQEFVFQNTFESLYSLEIEEVSEIAETLTWDERFYGSENALVNYRIQASVNSDFSSIDYESVDTRELLMDLLNSTLFSLAEAAGLDNDPGTTDPNGNPNNSGTIYIRAVSFVGNFNSTHEVKQYSTIQALNIELVEIQCEGSELSTWGFVGPFNEWNVNSTPVYAFLTTNSPGIFSGVVTLDDQGFKITVLDGSWSQSYAYGGSEGTLVLDTGFDAVIPSNSGHFLMTADLQSLTYSLQPTTAYGLIGPATPNSWDGPNHKFVPDECEPGVYIARNVPMVVGEFFIRANDDWTESYSLGDSAGTFMVNPGIGATGMPVASDGNYDVIINFNDFTYQLIAI